MAQKSWKIEEIFPRFVNAQMAKGVSDKTVLTYNRHFHSLGFHPDMTMTFSGYFLIDNFISHVAHSF